MSISGHYWTDRVSGGDMEFAARSDKLTAGFEQAAKLSFANQESRAAAGVPHDVSRAPRNHPRAYSSPSSTRGAKSRLRSRARPDVWARVVSYAGWLVLSERDERGGEAASQRSSADEGADLLEDVVSLAVGQLAQQLVLCVAGGRSGLYELSDPGALLPDANLTPLVEGQPRVAEATLLELVADLVDDVLAELPGPYAVSQISHVGRQNYARSYDRR